MIDFLYRYDIVLVSIPDWFEDSSYTGVNVELTVFPVIKETSCGVWIDSYHGKKFVNLQKVKQFACKTKEEAKESFIKRKIRQQVILTAQLNTVTEALRKFK